MPVVANSKPSWEANSHPSSPEVLHLKERKKSSLLGCDAVLLGEWFLMFPQNIVPSCSGSNSPTYLSLEDEGTIFLKNVVNNFSSGIASYPRRLKPWATLLWVPQILHKKLILRTEIICLDDVPYIVSLLKSRILRPQKKFWEWMKLNYKKMYHYKSLMDINIVGKYDE